jgi:TetR/AcrR family transcriptional regulator, transcriptional repressor for nem operon
MIAMSEIWHGRHIRQWREILAEVVEQAQRDGDLPNTTEPAELGRLLLAVMQGIEFLRKSGMTASH